MSWKPKTWEERLMFKPLTDEQEKEFRAWVHINFTVGMAIDRVWHPVVIDEVRKILKDRRGPNE